MRLFKDHDMDFQAKIALGGAFRGGSDVGEVLATIGEVKSGDFEGWHRAWTATADRVAEVGETAAKAGHAESARAAFLRAATYYHEATWFLDSTDDPSRFLPTWRKHRACWDRVVELTGGAVTRLDVPYDPVPMPGYLFRAAGSSNEPRPVVIMNNGSDGPISDMWVSGGAGAVSRGYHAFVFDGPGQNAMLYEHGVTFRPDWEHVIAPVVDALVATSGVDASKLALWGVSQGGYWVPRALGYEHRIAAGIADPGVWDVAEAWESKLSKHMLALVDDHKDDAFERDVRMAEHFDKGMAGSLAFRARPYGADTFADMIRTGKAFHLDDDGVAAIACPMLIADPEGEAFWPGQSKRLAEALGDRATLVPFTAAEGADLHCEPLAPALREQRVFDWLAGVFGV